MRLYKTGNRLSRARVWGEELQAETAVQAEAGAALEAGERGRVRRGQGGPGGPCDLQALRRKWLSLRGGGVTWSV